MSTAANEQPTSGMWAPYVPPEIGEKLGQLKEAGEFVLVAVTVREGVKTDYGPRDAVDLRVQTIAVDKTRVFSGFSAGIVGQAKRVQPGDLPAVCRIIGKETGRLDDNGKPYTTDSLELVRQLPAGVDVVTIAQALSVPIAPVAPAAAQAHDDIPY
jgi:hypothetical protein